MMTQSRQFSAISAHRRTANVGIQLLYWLNRIATHNAGEMEKQMSFSNIFKKPVRVTITVPHNIYINLKSRSDEEGRSLSNLAAFLIEKSLD
jgi:hypothetical protein